MASYNFSAGPAVLPAEVLATITRDLADAQGTGMSVLEISHRSPEFEAIRDSAEKRLRELMAIPEDYAVIFMQGGGSQAFTSAPLNFAIQQRRIALLDSGQWAAKAGKSAGQMTNPVACDTVASTKAAAYQTLPQLPEAIDARQYDYLHITTNNTIEGTAYHANLLPDTPLPLVADMSSNILAEPYDVTRFGAIFAGAQKNIGPAGLTIAIVRQDWLDQVPDNVPATLDWRLQAAKKSLYNTPPAFQIYVADLVFAHLLANGGVAGAYARNVKQAQQLYVFLDASDFYTAPVAVPERSLTNIVFHTPTAEADRACAAAATAAGLYALAGHRSVGGLRASLYNAQTDAAVTALCDFLTDFAKQWRQG